MDLTNDGAAHLPGAAAPFLSALETKLTGIPANRAGVRLHGTPGLAELLSPSALGREPATLFR